MGRKQKLRRQKRASLSVAAATATATATAKASEDALTSSTSSLLDSMSTIRSSASTRNDATSSLTSSTSSLLDSTSTIGSSASTRNDATSSYENFLQTTLATLLAGAACLHQASSVANNTLQDLYEDKLFPESMSYRDCKKYQDDVIVKYGALTVDYENCTLEDRHSIAFILRMLNFCMNGVFVDGCVHSMANVGRVYEMSYFGGQNVHSSLSWYLEGAIRGSYQCIDALITNIYTLSKWDGQATLMLAYWIKMKKRLEEWKYHDEQRQRQLLHDDDYTPDMDTTNTDDATATTTTTATALTVARTEEEDQINLFRNLPEQMVGNMTDERLRTFVKDTTNDVNELLDIVERRCVMCDKRNGDDNGDGTTIKLKQCMGCKIICYCSEECQSIHYVKYKHRNACKHFRILKKYHRPYAKAIRNAIMMGEVGTGCTNRQKIRDDGNQDHVIPALETLRDKLGLSRPYENYNESFKKVPGAAEPTSARHPHRNDPVEFLVAREDGTVWMSTTPATVHHLDPSTGRTRTYLTPYPHGTCTRSDEPDVYYQISIFKTREVTKKDSTQCIQIY